MKTTLILVSLVALLGACKQRIPQVLESTEQPSSSLEPNSPPPQAAPIPQHAEASPQGPEPVIEKPAAAPRQPAPVAQVGPSTPVPSRAETVTIREGSVFRVRIDETIDTRRNRAGDSFKATLIRPVDVDGVAVIPGGTRCTGTLVESKPSGRFKGHAVLSLRLDSFQLNGRTYDVKTSRTVRMSGGHKKGNWISIGGGAGVGAAFGAIAGPGGALIGAGAGVAAGSTVRAFTGKKNVRLPVETRLSFTLRAPATLAE